jgi:DNA-binding NarL/FixJ family response regulator
MKKHRGTKLSERELQGLRLAARGYVSKRIAAEMGISQATVAWHLGNASRKLGAANRIEAVAIALKRGLIEGGVD